MNTNSLTALVYVLGFLGLASVGLIPFRSWCLLRELYSAKLRKNLNVFLFIAGLIVATGAFLADLQITLRIFKCLTQRYCGPSIASGWGYLAMLGVVYVGFESLSFALRKLVRRA
jgi:hypothetical protein